MSTEELDRRGRRTFFGLVGLLTLAVLNVARHLI